MDKDIDIELQLLKKEVENLKKENKLLKKQIDTQESIINNFALNDKDKIKKYIDENNSLQLIIKALEFSNYKVHRQAFKRFITNKDAIDISILNDEQLANAIIDEKYRVITTKILNKRLEELKILGLVDFDKENYHLIGTDALATMMNNNEYTRVIKSIPDESLLKYTTEDKLISYRLQDKEYLNELLETDKQDIDKFKIYHNIHVVSNNKFVIGRKSNECEKKLYQRIAMLLKSSLIDRETIYLDERLQYKDIILYIHDSIRITEETLYKYIKTPRDNKQLIDIRGKIIIKKYKT